MPSSTKEHLIDLLRQEISAFEFSPTAKEVGTVLEVSDGVVRASGLTHVSSMEMVEFEKGGAGVVLNLEQDNVGVMVFGEDRLIAEGDIVKRTGRILEVPVGDKIIGRVVNPLGQPLDEQGEIQTNETLPVEKVAPGVITRQSVNTPVQTGITAIDAMIPIGRGQRELIIGDRQTGKKLPSPLIPSSIKRQGSFVYLCCHRPKSSKTARIVAELRARGAMEYTTVVVSAASDPAALQYIAPYAGCAMAEYFMNKGKDVLIVYDDLSKHAWAYRNISLILRRPPGTRGLPGGCLLCALPSP